ncbi:MAG TPA: NADH-quinone oxidoreductase subunit C [Candidatus Acidoferrales bacterium]|nr:NADH-quinone oxidoreductase subunit C [Candidatus Acidoferrales bacterium]
MKEEVESRLRSSLGDAIVSVDEFNEQVSIEIKRDRITDVCKILKEELGFNYLSDLCGADMLNYDDASARKAYLAIEHEHRPHQVPNEERFLVVYQLTSLKDKSGDSDLGKRLRLKVKVDGDNPVCPSITSVFKSANWYEREAFDMFGIEFEGHPDMRRMYMPEEYEYYPLRKDFPLMGVPGSIPLPRR